MCLCCLCTQLAYGKVKVSSETEHPQNPSEETDQSSASSHTQEVEKNLPAPFEEWIHSTCLCGICVRSEQWRCSSTTKFSTPAHTSAHTFAFTVNAVIARHFQCDDLSSQSLHKNLHPTGLVWWNSFLVLNLHGQ